jgi:hypothetical protein
MCLFGKVSHAFFKVIRDDTERTSLGGLLRESLPTCVRRADENHETEGRWGMLYVEDEL